MLQNLTNEFQPRAQADLILALISTIGLAIVVGIAYFFAARLSLALLVESDGVALFWPAAGVSSGVLIALGRTARLPVACGVIVATIFANLMGDRSVWNASASALWNTGEALVTAWLVECYFGSSFSLDRLRNVLGLLAAAVIATAASGIGGMASFKLFHSPTAPMWTTWQHWFMSDFVGIITVAPLIIGLANALREPPPRNEILEGIVALVALTAVIVVIVVFAPARAVADGASGHPAASCPAVAYSPLPAGVRRGSGVYRFTNDCLDNNFWHRSFRGSRPSNLRPRTRRQSDHHRLYAIRIRCCGAVCGAASA
jgi:integral membrane sensor domain MASE1